jgi:hypothetical protein
VHRAEGITADVGGNRGIDPGWSLADPRGATWILDGATGSGLERRGNRSDVPMWSAHALLERPESVEAVHAVTRARRAARAGARPHSHEGSTLQVLGRSG